MKSLSGMLNKLNDKQNNFSNEHNVCVLLKNKQIAFMKNI